jgi:Tfp pilus assembly pilus retraction ATPase PilT
MADLPKIFEDLLALAVENAASDVHLKTGRPALMRVAGQLVETEMAPLTAEQLNAFVDATLPARFQQRWVRDSQVDYSFDRMAQGKGRFRVNAFLQRNQPAAVLRGARLRLSLLALRLWRFAFCPWEALRLRVAWLRC